MNDTNSTSSRKRKSPAKLTAGGGVLGVLIVLYALLQPMLSKQLGIDLPKFPINTGSQPPMVVDSSRENDSTAKIHVQPTQTETSAPAKNGQASETKPSAADSDAKLSARETSTTKSGGGPLAEFNRTKTSGADKASPTKSAGATQTTAKTDPSLRYGILKSIGRDVYLSPAGLRYTPGSQEGHRLKHLERHTEDQPSRPGKHGVFDGGMEKTLAVLDQAYEKGTKGGHGTTKTEDDGRTIYTVDMGRRVGFIGGRDGNRMRKPMARRVRIVLDGDRVITAYPL